MLTPLDTISTHLDVNGWNYECDDQNGRFRTGFTSDTASFELLLDLDDQEGRLHAAALFPTRVPAPHRISAAIFCAYANCGLILGRLEYDYDGGRLGFCVTVPYEPGHLPGSVVLRTVECVAHLSDTLHSTLLSIVYGGQEPRAAFDKMLAELEKDNKDDEAQDPPHRESA